MSDLQLALLALGAVIIFAVVAFNWWQERKFKNAAGQAFDTPRRDALMDEDFHFDESAILTDESRDTASDGLEQADSGDAMPVSIIETETEDSLYKAPLEQEEPPYQSDSRWAELDEELADVEPIQEQTAETTSTSYEDHVWQSNMQASEGLEDNSYEQNGESEDDTIVRAELNEEAGLDQPFQVNDPQPAYSQASPVIDTSTLSSDIDPRVDLIALLYLPQPVAGEQLREFLMSASDIDKPKYLHGLDTDGVWRLMTREQAAAKFTRASCALQLADRSGFVSRNSLNRFQHEVDRIGLKLNAQVEWQSKGDPWQAASELDQFCIDVDKMVGFHLVQGGNGPFTGTKFRGLAEANGMSLGSDGAFHSENEHGLRQFSVVNRDNHPFSPDMLRTSVIYGVTFQLDIPRVKNCPEIFNQMVLTARQMESSLGATLVDDNQRPIGEVQIEKIRQQLKVIHAKMVARGIVPGSQSALRLFS